jgi:hypothetical protein
MELTVKNSTPPATVLTLFAEMRDGSFNAKVMPETDVPYTPYWEDQVDQVTVYIHPQPDQLKTILDALAERRLAFGDLQNYGSSAGGESVFRL